MGRVPAVGVIIYLLACCIVAPTPTTGEAKPPGKPPVALASASAGAGSPIANPAAQGGTAAQQQQPPNDPFPKNFWFEFTSPFTESYDDQDNGESVTEETPGVEVTAEPLPYFEGDGSTANVTAQLGSTVILHCHVNDLNDKTVSWVRRHGEELRLITFGLHTYVSDSRFTLVFQQPNDWRLQIRYAGTRDQGHYECQVSSHPPVVLHVLLNVVAPRVEIVDERGVAIGDKFYKAGSTIELKCVISQVPHPSTYVTWRHGLRMLNYDTSRGGISVKTDILSSGATSFLYIANANQHDSGNYSCALADVADATISVHVLNGESPAAMQHSGCRLGLSRVGPWPLWPLGLLATTLLQHWVLLSSWCCKVR